MTALAVIVAAGKGTRMKGKSTRKQYLPIAGMPVLSHTLLAFEKCERLDGMILVIPERDADYCRREVIAPLGPKKRIDLVFGGPTRQASVYNGLCAIDSKDSIVAIHDGVRPMVSPRLLSLCIEGAEKSGACILGVPVSDTVKYVDRCSHIDGTLERENIWFAQTPQAFRYDLIMEAHHRARQDGHLATDDSSLVERLGVKVRIIRGCLHNIKITRTEDIAVCEALLRSQRDWDSG